jgi:tetratricopeptide (TPR) repeat protein
MILPAAAQDTEFKLANDAYLLGNYEEALSQYKLIEADGWQDAALYYNMGNCLYELGELGESILYYEKALKLEPDDEDIQHNLNFVRRKTVDRIEALPQPFLRSLLTQFASINSSGTWAALFLLVWFAIMTLLIMYIWVKGKRKRSFFISGVVLLPVALILLSMMYIQKKEESREFGIILELNAYVKDGPGQASDDLFILHEGTKSEILDRYDGWFKIKLSDGKIGWIEASQLGEI